MNEVAADIWPVVLGTVFSVVVTYVGFINRMRIQNGVLEEKVAKLEKNCDDVSDKLDEIDGRINVQDEKVRRIELRQDSHSKKNDEIIKLINEFKIEVIKQLGALATNMGKLSSDIDNFNRIVSINDAGIKFKKKEG